MNNIYERKRNEKQKIKHFFLIINHILNLAEGFSDDLAVENNPVLSIP